MIARSDTDRSGRRQAAGAARPRCGGPAAPTSGGAAAPIPVRYPRGRRRVLLADDVPTLRRAYAHALRQSGHEVTAVANGNAALAVLAAATTGGPEIVVAEVAMPVLDGVSMVRAMRERGSTVPVLMLGDDAFLHDLALHVGADRYLNRPFGPADLLGAVGSLVPHRRSRPPSAAAVREPAVWQEASVPGPGARTPLPRQRCARHVLVLAACAEVRRGYVRTLSTAGYGVSAAGGVRGAAALVGARPPDVAVIEVGEAGDAASALIAALAVRRVPVLAVGRRPGDEPAAHRASAFLVRPLGSHVLLSTVRMLLDGAHRPVPAVPHECGGASDPPTGPALGWFTGGGSPPP
ncbi:response regulator [Pseudonocardia sp.]|uniref:response regulator transcription factor n=1 Tax=Pseudonocardia sp. TaxID=60912 RepID=UPI0026368955|nr:response regulator [Pseudonocardia sp.]